MPFYEEYILRPLSFPIANLLLKTNITPNQVTVFSNLLIIISSYLYYIGYKQWSIFLILSYFILDCVDGEIAREKNLQSDKGAIMEEKLPVIFLVGFYFFCVFLELGSFYAFMYLFSVHIINTLSFLNERGAVIVSDKSNDSFKDSALIWLRYIFSFIKSPVVFALVLVSNIHVLLLIIVYSVLVTAVYKFYLLWKL